jgi:hypothetical protein
MQTKFGFMALAALIIAAPATLMAAEADTSDGGDKTALIASSYVSGNYSSLGAEAAAVSGSADAGVSALGYADASGQSAFDPFQGTAPDHPMSYDAFYESVMGLNGNQREPGGNGE